ncbi:hypothetical protein CYMTET_10802 [Cymbomonas tetramitiformis]|uniref:DUF1805 domain-containing protein n=1 Tax=Cymbomonas tetramitiformis TaxID=36881 RepID=A0AAE0GNK1_9CHLO|nr:hypothetical protein CYMTET_10802 [Cymbomonas tetramitiformis]
MFSCKRQILSFLTAPVAPNAKCISRACGNAYGGYAPGNLGTTSLGALAASFCSAANFDWQGLERHSISGLNRPLLAVLGTRGLLACGYISAERCGANGDACATVTGVDSHEDMLHAKVEAISDPAERLGLKIGMTGAEALALLR